MPLELLGSPSNQSFQDIPWRFKEELISSPSSETLLSPTAQGIMLSTSPRELPAEGEDTPSLGSGLIGVLLLGDFYLLDIKVEVYRAVFFIKLHVTHENVEWRALGDLVYVIGCDKMG